ncbi:hypothetical protein [Psychroserpens algicola]|uniref:Polymer-forming cytoskeletal protein n=1 Tax=Psychroserpens algicola TaxID=1719034 RepID=A0ABT0H979_9FLAO|nr:hypothetical protein [Psychroserpens algicola]MCK8480931.1 hypothetical protein [Psychroserpens algicola]
MFLKASSLTNAIFVCLMISIFSGCLVLISHYQNLLNSKLDFRETLINTNNASFKYYAQNLNLLDYNMTSEIDLFDDDIITYSTKKKWGFYDILSTKTIFKSDTIHNIGLIGSLNTDKNSPSLFVTDYDKPLKLSGNTKISGTSKIPSGFIEQAYINGQTGNNTEVKGQLLSSEDKLPQLRLALDMDIASYQRLTIDQFKSNKIINSFDSETIVIDVSNLSELGDISIRGNIIIFSSGRLKISNSAQLNDVVLIAKHVLIEQNFSGNLQIIAKNSVTIDENALLKYPSSVSIENDQDSVKVHFKPSSRIAGGVILNGNTYKGSLKRKLIIDESAKIYGSVYCYGRTQLQGEVVGQLYTDRFFLKTQSSDYENVILNGSVNGDSLPKNFVQLPLFNSRTSSSNYEIIKEF